MDWLLEIDTRLFLAINGFHSPLWDNIMWWVSGKITWWPFYLLILGYLGYTKKWQLVPMILFIIVGIILTDQTSVHLFKNVFHRLRPCHEPMLEDMVHLVKNRCGGQYGFISSHAANTFGVALLVMGWARKNWVALVMVIWALLVGYSRIYLGVHYPGDVIVGGLWGAGCGWLLTLLYRWLLSNLPPRLKKYVLHSEQ
jgi:undecaprenyl-diphosphatase